MIPRKRKRGQFTQKASWLTAVGLALFTVPLQAQRGDPLAGVGLRESTDYDGYTKLSLMGGAKLLAKANSGIMNDEAGANTISYQSLQISGNPVFPGPLLSRDDEFFSNPQEGKLAFTSAAPKDIFKTDYFAFDGQSDVLPDWGSIYLQVQVTNQENPDQPLECTSTPNNCRIMYQFDFTPMLHDVVPNQLYKDQPIDWVINIWSVHSSSVTPADAAPFEELSIDGNNNYFIDVDDDDEDIRLAKRLAHSRLDRIQAYVGDQRPNKSSVPRARFITGDSFLRKTSLHCNFAGDDCWRVRTHARIDSISAVGGYTSGGQELKINGWGLDRDVTVTVAGVTCEVKSMSMEEVVCVTGVADAESVENTLQPGQPGIRRRKMDPDYGTYINFNSLENELFPFKETTHELVFESVHDYDFRYGQLWDGFFSPPETGNYRFHMSCDDPCKLLMDATNPLSSGNEIVMVEISNRTFSTTWREYLEPPEEEDESQYISDWIALDQGEHYAIEALFWNNGGPGHITVSLEFEKADQENHPMAMKETQVFTIDQDNTPETWELIVTNPSDGEYKLAFQDPVTLDFTQTNEVLTADMSASTFRNRIYYPYYRSTVGSTTTVTKTSYDIDGFETEVAEDIVTVKYKVELDKRITGQSFASIQVLKTRSNQSGIEIVLPTDAGGLLSTPPLSGRFIIQCPDPDNSSKIHESPEISYNSWSPGIEYSLARYMPYLAGKVVVRDFKVPGQKYLQNARQFAIQFLEFERDVPQCSIVSGVNTPLVGQNLVLTSETLHEYGQNLFFEPIPQEFMVTPAMAPQVLVEIDGVPAACASLNCDYLYANSVAEITAISLTGLDLSITGTGFVDAELIDVRLGEVSCGPTTPTSATLIECTLMNAPAAGSYTSVEVQDENGVIRMTTGQVTPIDVPLELFIITPFENVNRFGGETLTIKGSGFPQSTDYVTVEFEDGTVCDVTETSEDELKCTTNEFDLSDPDFDPLDTITFTVTVDYVTTVSETTPAEARILTINFRPAKVEAAQTEISPSSASPVLRQELTVNFGDGFLLDISNRDRYVVYLVGVTDPTYRRQIYIYETDDTARTMTLKFNGAPSGDYKVFIQLKSALANSGPQTLEIASITPSTGSTLGGTLVTITTSGTEALSGNQVVIGFNLCIVESYTDTQLVCRIQLSSFLPPSDGQVVNVIMLSNVRADVSCLVADPGCVFTFQDPPAAITAMTAEFDTSDNMMNIVVEIANTVPPLALYIDGEEVTYDSATSTEFIFKLDYAKDLSTTDIQFYDAQGTVASVPQSLDFVQALVGFSINEIPLGGAIFQVYGVGFGVETTDINLQLDGESDDLCSAVEVTGYGTFKCTIDPNPSISGTVVMRIGTDQIACANTLSATDCDLEVLIQANSPEILTVTQLDDEEVLVEITQIWQDQPYGIYCEFKGIVTSVTVVNNAIDNTWKDIICDFSNTEVPADSDSSYMDVFFVTPTNFDTLYFWRSSPKLVNPINVTGQVANDCSFMGGCTFEVTAQGFTSTLLGDQMNNFISICGMKCEVDTTLSDIDKAVCILPPFVSTYTVANYGLGEIGMIETTWTGSGTNPEVLNDSVTNIDYVDTNIDCYAEITAPSDKTYFISEVSIYLQDVSDKTPFDGNLKIQGSDDGGSTFTDLHTFDSTVVMGWNTVDFESNGPEQYPILRVQGAVAGSCAFSEIKVLGYEYFTTNDSTVDCTGKSKISIAGDETALDPVELSSSLTPTVSRVYPRVLDDAGGETLEIFGSFPDTGAAIVELYGETCTIVDQTTTKIEVTTPAKPAGPDMPSLKISVGTSGNAFTQGKVPLYLSSWNMMNSPKKVAITRIVYGSGSNLGLKTFIIEGYNFDTEVAMTDPVTVGGHSCVVSDISATSITCQIFIADGVSQTNGEEDVLIASKSGDPMECLIDISAEGDGCYFTFKDPKATITAVTAAYSSQSNRYVLTVDGTGLIILTLSVEGQPLTIITDTLTQFTFALPTSYVKDTTITDFLMYESDGKPAGVLSSITIDPVLHGFSIQAVLSTGGLFFVEGLGFGIDTTDINLQIKDQSTDLCSEVKVTGFGIFECTFDENTNLPATSTVVMRIGTTQYDCTNTDAPEKCNLEIIPQTNHPIVTQTQNYSPVMVRIFTQMNGFDTTGYTWNLELGGNEIQGVYYFEQTDANTGIKTIQYDFDFTSVGGVPTRLFQNVGPGPPGTIFYVKDTTLERLYLSPKPVELYPIIVDDYSAVDCSFAGGCTFSVDINGFAGVAKIDPENTFITVCNQRCEIDFEASSVTQTVCTMSPYVSVFSVTNYGFGEIGMIETTWTGSGTNPEVLNDSVTNIDYVDANNDCYAEITAPSDKTYFISEVSIYLQDVSDKTPFDGNLKIQGSDDGGSTFTDLHTFDSTVVMGWNTVDFESNGPEQYPILRVQGAVAGSCAFSEIKVLGFEAFSQNSSPVQCSMSSAQYLTLYGEVSPDQFSSIKLQSELTPTVDSITPIFLDDAGNETLEFNGSFPETGDAIVKLYGVTCTLVSQTASKIQVTTTAKPSGDVPASLSLFIGGAGNAAMQGNTALYQSTFDEEQSSNVVVTSISPPSGSALGGTVITIVGQNFDTQATEDPVTVGSNACEVISRTATEIQCKILIAEGVTQAEQSENVIVASNSGNPMTCLINVAAQGDGCVFTFATPATVTSITEEFDNDLGTIVLTVSGTAFDSLELSIDGVQQVEQTGATATAVQFALSGVKDTSSTDIKMTNADGVPAGVPQSITFTPALIDFAYDTIMYEGAIFEVNGAGFGVETTNINLQLTGETDNLCTSVLVLDYGKFECSIIAPRYTLTTSDVVVLVVDGVQYGCETSDCVTEIIPRAYSPAIFSTILDSPTQVTLSVITRIGFTVSLYTYECEFQGYRVTGTASDDSNAPLYQATCDFSPFGVPVADDPTIVSLLAKPNGREAKVIIKNKSFIDVEAEFTSSSAVVAECSFGGGCNFAIAGTSIMGALVADPENNYIQVCGKTCDLVNQEVPILCSVPTPLTKYAFTNFQIGEDMIGPLTKGWIGSGSNPEVLNDEVTNVDYSGNPSTDCQATIEASDDYIFAITRVRIYLQDVSDPTPFDGNLKIQGSNDDGATFTDLHTFDNTVEMGWNVVNFIETGPEFYKLLRIYGAVDGSCDFSEVEVVGVELIDSEDSTFTCADNKLFLSGEEFASLDDQVYSEAQTPLVDTIVPSFGSDEGGYEIELTGSFLSGDATVTIYGEDCPVQTNDSSSITCLVAAKPSDVENPSISVFIDGAGYAATQGNLFRYVPSGGLGQLQGKIGTELDFRTIIAVDSITPTTGSTLGGTLLTITGAHFGLEATDNPVKVGDHYCVIQSTSDAEIKCRILIEDDDTQPEAVADVIVFARTFEEMECLIDISETGDGCVFTYAEPTVTVTDVTEAFDSKDNTIKFTVNGSGFTADDTVNTELWIDGVKQTTDTVSGTQAVFVLDYADDITSSDIKFYTVEGLPSGPSLTASFTPALIGFSLNVGSFGGAVFSVYGVGFGPETTGINLRIVGQSSTLCSSVEVTGYGEFICTMPSSTAISSSDPLEIVIGSTGYPCANTQTAADCDFVSIDSSSPIITGITVDSKDPESTLIVTVSQEYTNGSYDVECEFRGITTAGTLVTNDGTGDEDVICTFDYGIPLTITPEPIDISFASESGKVYAKQGGQTVSFASESPGAAADHDCSYNGGCKYRLENVGVSALLVGRPEENKIEICGQVCLMDEELTDGTEAVCTMAPLQTIGSAMNYGNFNMDLLDVSWYDFDEDVAVPELSDGINTVDWVQPDTTCELRVTAKQGYAFFFSDVKIFLNNLIDKTPFQGNLVLEGQYQGGSWEQIYTFDNTIHEGWNSANTDSTSFSYTYDIVRLVGSASGSCRIGEIKIYGAELFDSQAPSVDCPAILYLADYESLGGSLPLGTATYSGDATPQVDSISTRFVSVLGGDEVTFTGTFFDDGDATVLIDNRPCVISSKSGTEIVCDTSDKPFVPGEPTLSVYIEGYGSAQLGGQLIRYVSRWSDEQTWGYDLLPMEGEAVNIPSGLQLLVDVPSTPVLSFVLVEGALLFESQDDEDTHMTFDTNYIMVNNGGYMEIGTEDYPYMSKLTITMHGNVRDPYLPTYGNKVTAVRFGQLEMHGKPRNIVWTDLKETAEAGDDRIKINDVTGDPLDWVVGEYIVIASTDFDGRHAEKRMIEEILGDATNPILVLDSPLEWKHYAGVQTFGSDTVEMRAEVGLLSRNVVYRGDPETSEGNQYGAHIMLHSPGDESVIGRIENCEFFDVGQAFKLGRYPIHFHMIGTVTKSYIKKNSIHQTYNRATTLHGVHYLEISGNVAYKAMGHTIFIEDAIETKNLIMNNLVVDTRASNSLLNTDQSPACFWITNPDNIFRGNHAAGSDRYGYWFDLQVTSTGPSFDPNICPENTKLGEFTDNVAHSAGRYGLRIFHNLIPRTYPCQSLVYSGNPSDPYPDNPPITAQFERFLGYKNNRNGAIAERVGAIEFIDFKTADNILAGIEFSLTENMIDGYAKVIDAVVVGRSENTESLLDSASPHGIIAPRTEGFTIEGVKFFNFDWNEAAALGDCSHCFHPAATDSGARTYTVADLEFTDVTRKIKYQYPYRGIFHDLTGSLTDQGADTFATKSYPHLVQPECSVDDVLYDGVVCDDTVQIRRVAFFGYKPNHFQGLPMNILKWDNEILDAFRTDEEYEAYLDDSDNYSSIFFKSKLKPNNGWAVPYVTGHIYRITWANDLDYTEMRFEVSERWEEADNFTYFQIPFIDAREAINVTVIETGEQVPNNTISSEFTSDYLTGYNYLQNQTDVRQFLIAVNGVDPERKTILLEGLQCIEGVCPQEGVDYIPINEDQTFWSDPEMWPLGYVPLEGEDVVIEPYMNVVLDIITPIHNLVTVNGRLSFYDAAAPIDLRAKQVYVRAGELLIGSEENPFLQTASITLYGERDEATEVMSGSFETGNKLLLNTGLMKFVGASRDTHTRLKEPVFAGDYYAIVDIGLDWGPGDEIYFAPTNLQWQHSEYRIVVNYNEITGLLEIDEPLEFYHYGALRSTETIYSGVDTRGEVRLLSRNIKVVGAPTPDLWGGNILTVDRMEFDGTLRIATTQFDYVEVKGCSQENTYHAAIRFENTGQSKVNYVNYTSVHDSRAWSLYVSSSRLIEIKNSDFIGSYAVGVNLNSVNNVIVDNCFIGDVKKRELTAGDKFVDKEACVAFCSYFEPNICQASKVTNSIAAGCAFAGFVAPGHNCDEVSTIKFRDNVAHSNERVGAHIYPDPGVSRHSKCYEGRYFAAYKNRECGISTMYSTADLRMRDMVFIDNQLGITLQTAGEREDITILLKDTEIYGEGDNDDCLDGQPCFCPEKYGLMLFSANRGGKPLHPTSASQLPIHKIKSYGSWGGYANFENVNFHNFKARTKCGARQSVFQRNPFSSDYIPPHKFVSTQFDEVEELAMAYIKDPNPGWANPTDCVDWPCTAPENVILYFERTTYAGSTTPTRPIGEFQIVSDVEPAIEAYNLCQLRPNWSAAFCTNPNLGILLFESLDEDTEDRTVSPVVITSDNGYENRLNSMMDHVWDGFYTGQKRLSRFPGQIETDHDYEIAFTGTPPASMRFVLKADRGAIKFRIYYPNAGSYTVYADDVEKEYTPWNKEIGRHAALTKQEGCGENRFVGIENFLEFYITTDCEIRVAIKDQIQISVRLDWTLDEFYANEGYTRFVDRVAAVLDVQPSQIRTVAIYRGSVVVDYFVEPLPEDPEPKKTLKKASKKFFKAVDEEALDLGAPVISASANLRKPTDLTYDGFKPLEGNLWDYILEERAQYEKENGINTNSTDTVVVDDDEDDIADEWVWTPKPKPEPEPEPVEPEEEDTTPGEGDDTTDGTGEGTEGEGTEGDGTEGEGDNTDEGPDDGDETDQETITTEEDGNTFNTNVVIIEVATSEDLSETSKYLIGLLVALVIALIFVAAYLYMTALNTRRAAAAAVQDPLSKVEQQYQLHASNTETIMSRKQRKLKGSAYLARPKSAVSAYSSSRRQDGSPMAVDKVIYVATEDDGKDIFTGQRQKVNQGDDVIEMALTERDNNQEEVNMFGFVEPDEPLPTQGNMLITEADLPDTARMLRPASSRTATSSRRFLQ